MPVQAMSDIIETENGRVYVNRVPPCGHTNGTHPGGCWWMAVCDAVVAERARIVAAVTALPTLVLPTGTYVDVESVFDVIDGAGRH
jgi:hypothetical protein